MSSRPTSSRLHLDSWVSRSGGGLQLDLKVSQRSIPALLEFHILEGKEENDSASPSALSSSSSNLHIIGNGPQRHVSVLLWLWAIPTPTPLNLNLFRPPFTCKKVIWLRCLTVHLPSCPRLLTISLGKMFGHAIQIHPVNLLSNFPLTRTRH